MKSLKLILISLASALIGAAGLLIFFQYKPETALNLLGLKAKEPSIQDSLDSLVKDQDKIFRNFDSVFGEDFFKQENPFEEMRKFRERLGKQIRPKNDSFSSSPFDSWYEDKFGGSVEEVSQREDDKFVYYDIKLPGVDGSSVKTKVQDGYLSVIGEVKKSQESGSSGGGMRSFYESSFTRTFPLPENVVGEKMEMTSEKDKLVLKFPKRKS